MTTWRSYPRDTTLRVLLDAAEKHGDQLFVDVNGRSLTYGEFASEVHRLARGLAERGVQKGDTVATMLDNNAEALVAWFAINAVGAIQVPVNTALRGAFLQHVLDDSDARLVIAEGRYTKRLPRGLEVIRRGPAEAADEGLKVTPLDDVYADDDAPLGFEPSPSDLSVLYYTAGTTGPSKGCMVSHNFVCHLARESLKTTGRTAAEHQWTALPLFHMNAPVMTGLATMTIGGSATVEGRFSVSGFWSSIERSGASVVILLGSMAHLIATMDDNDAMERTRGQIRVVWALPFAPSDIEVWKRRFGVQLAGSPGYGQTETGYLVSTSLDDPGPPGASGRRNEFFDVIVVDDDDQEVPVGTPGEVVARPRTADIMFSGYWKRPEATVAAWRNLWYHTGDIGRFDEDGWFYFVDRKKDYLRRRGENISSVEMEAAICQHPDVEEAAVFAVPSEVTEDDVKVVVTLRPGSTLTEEELCRWTFDKVPYFAVPRYVEIRDELPKNEVGRVLKRELRDAPDARACWDREAVGIAVPRDADAQSADGIGGDGGERPVGRDAQESVDG